MAGGPEEVPVGVWQGDRRVAWTGVNGLGAGPRQLHTAPGLNLRVLEAIEASSRVCVYLFFFLVCVFERNLHL